MVTRAFPVVYASDVGRTARFWERLGFTRFYQLPADGEPGYVALRRGDAELAVVAGEWVRDQYGLAVGDGPRFEMFVYADDVDRLFDDLRDEGTTVLRDPADMPWGERIASIADPDGNPVTLASEHPVAQLCPCQRPQWDVCVSPSHCNGAIAVVPAGRGTGRGSGSGGGRGGDCGHHW